MSHPLEARNVGYTWGDRRILGGVDLQLAPGEILGIIGPNGAGKSTLLRCLGGLVPSEGTVELQGRQLGSLKPRQIALLATLMRQSTEVPFPLPSSEIVLMGRYPHQRRFQPTSAEDRRIVEKVMAFTDTQSLAHQAIDTLSGGERQRVLFAKSLAQETAVLLLDEPSASLDISHQEQIFRYARRLASEGKAIVAAIHDLRLAARFCTRVVLMSQGTVLAEGVPEHVLTPENLRQAYGVGIRVFRNQTTGEMDFHIHEPESGSPKPSVHVIGGGGTAAEVLRWLGDEGYPVTCGVLTPGDSDLHVAQVYGASAVISPPFCSIGDDAHQENCARIRAASITVVCNLVIGAQNLRNLEAATEAQSLVLLEDTPPEGRDLTGGPGLEVYRALRSRATVLTTRDWARWLASRKTTE